MHIRSIALALIVLSSVVLVAAQTPDEKKGDNGKPRTGEKLRDIPFAGGVDLKFLVTELARDMGLNVLFDVESFRGPRRMTIDLKNVTSSEALNYVLLQEGLFYEEAGPKTILIASRARGAQIPHLGIGITQLNEQLAEYFGVHYRGILINHIRAGSPAAKAGLKAGDVIVEIDGSPTTGALGLYNAINDKNGSDVTLKIVRNRKDHTITLTPQKALDR